MKRTDVFQQMGEAHAAGEKARRDIIAKASLATNTAKRAIFALHRGDAPGADQLLNEVVKLLDGCAADVANFPENAYEGAYRAALEEYAEAQLYRGYLDNGQLLVAIDGRCMRPDVYLAGLCDATGEVLRYAVRQATQGEVKAVALAKETVEAAAAKLYELDLSGYLRNKFDEAKRNLRQLEQMMYDLSLRGK
jgi:predicted translin family RNA/ssDNA-binding protein